MAPFSCLVWALVVLCVKGATVRKNVLELTDDEKRSLVDAMRLLQDDVTADGFQRLAAYHALPAVLCPAPGAEKGVACCVHGMPTFPHWHRLYAVQFEDALKRKGATVGVPYWDATAETTHLPSFLFDAEAYDGGANPWAGAQIAFEGTKVQREINQAQLYDGSWLLKQLTLALEQEDFCQFEVQFELAHNAIHAWIGGGQVYSMAHLHYASYDPLFISVHSFTDRVFALWQALQTLRGHNPNNASCAPAEMLEPLKPFSYGKSYNENEKTSTYSKPVDVFDYEDKLGYQYDLLSLGRLTVENALGYFKEEKSRDRVFATFSLAGIQTTATVTFSACAPSGNCVDAGFFYVLGGTAEMPWRFRLPYNYEVTDVLTGEMLADRSEISIKVTVTAQNGTVLPEVDLKPAVVTVRATVTP